MSEAPQRHGPSEHGLIDQVRSIDDGREVLVLSGDVVIAQLPTWAFAKSGCHIGQVLTPSVESTLAQLAVLVKAVRDAAALLARSPKSASELSDRLIAKGYSTATVQEALAQLTHWSLINDHTTATDLALKLKAKGHSNALIRESLDRRGLALPQEGKQEGEQEVAPETELQRASQVAQACYDRLPKTLDGPARWRRVLGALSRKGFDEATAVDAARLVLGEPPEEHDSL